MSERVQIGDRRMEAGREHPKRQTAGRLEKIHVFSLQIADWRMEAGRERPKRWGVREIMSACDQSADRGLENGGWKGAPQVSGHGLGRLEKFEREREV